MKCLSFLPSYRYPFDTNTPIGYLIAFAIEYITFAYEYFVIACTWALGICAFWFAISATTELQCILHSINNKHCKPNELRVFFSEYSYFHGIVLELSINFIVPIATKAVEPPELKYAHNFLFFLFQS